MGVPLRKTGKGLRAGGGTDVACIYLGGLGARAARTWLVLRAIGLAEVASIYLDVAVNLIGVEAHSSQGGHALGNLAGSERGCGTQLLRLFGPLREVGSCGVRHSTNCPHLLVKLGERPCCIGKRLRDDAANRLKTCSNF